MYSRYLKLCYARYDWIIDFSNGPMKTNDTLALPVVTLLMRDNRGPVYTIPGPAFSDKNIGIQHSFK